MLRLGKHLSLILTFFALSAAGIEVDASVGSDVGSSFGSQQEAPVVAQPTIRARTGDTLIKIAQRRGVPVAELIRLNGLNENTRLKKGMKIQVPADPRAVSAEAGVVVGNRITLSDGYSIEADEVWKDGDEIWFRKGKISQRLQQPVSSIRPIVKAVESKPAA